MSGLTIDEREAFESWMIKTWPGLPSNKRLERKENGRYRSTWISSRWEGWQARAAHIDGQITKNGLDRNVISYLIYKNTGIHETGFPEEFDELLTLCREIEYAITEPSK